MMDLRTAKIAILSIRIEIMHVLNTADPTRLVLVQAADQ